ncbi:MAG: dicarboxylate/amino acid:cation symporter [Gammaproteobacteria bacterium]|nr:dicarboxylate/amino acid:cation symporter [Gammaproteobacteria bacterium]
MPLHTRILIGLALGALFGAFAHEIRVLQAPASWFALQFAAPVGQLFLNLLLMLVVPLVFASLVVGVAGIGDLRRLGRVGAKSFVFSIVMSAISVVIGIALANGIAPGHRLDADVAAALREVHGAAAATQVASAAPPAAVAPLAQIVDALIPKNPIASLATPNPNMLHLMAFALAIGLGAALVPRARSASFIAALEGLSEIVARLIELVMKLAPLAVFCLVFNNVQMFGVGLLVSLGWFVGTVLLGLGLHLFGVYSAIVWWFARITPLAFFRAIRTAMLTAFSTSSSSATLPTSLRIGEEALGIPREINTFVLTVGATANQNGTALYEGITVLFLAQLAGIELTLAQQLMVVYLAILGGIGTAGVPAGSIPFVIAILASVGIDPALIAVVLGVDRILDMCRTTLNVSGDLAAAAYVARSEGYAIGMPRPAPVPE